MIRALAIFLPSRIRNDLTTRHSLTVGMFVNCVI